MGGQHLNQPIVGMTVDQATGGYWLVAADGGVFSFNAPFYGSTGNIRLNQPIVGIASTPSGSGYRFVAADGGVFSFNAPFYGSLPSYEMTYKPTSTLNPASIVGIADTSTGLGYYLLDGGGNAYSGVMWAFGDASCVDSADCLN
jgi:hypothetical protein